jgi:hypothetical protein
MDAVAEIDNEAMFCSSFDATNGYFQIPLHTASQHLTTFMTPWGRYKFLRASMGLCSSWNEYNRRTDATFGTLQNTVRVVDDILRYDRSFPSPIEGVCAILQATRAEKITLNADKLKFAQKKLVWAVYETQHGGVTVDPSKLQAIA